MNLRAALLVGLVAAACAPVETIVADIPAGGPPGACAKNADCPPDAFCAKAACADRVGACQRRPLVCNAAAQPACGCDGVSYWNECLRKQGGVAAQTPGECVTGAAPCGGPRRTECPVRGASCAQLVDHREACSETAHGVCWVMPDRCPPPEGRPPPGPGSLQGWSPCAGPPRCGDVCDAIRAGAAFRADDRLCGGP